jgi:uncharacterized phage protein gp47/JayE
MFPVPTLDEAHEFLIAVHKRHFPDIDVSEMSDAWLELRTKAAAMTDGSAHIEATKADLHPTTATGETQDDWGEFSGLERKGATAARKAFALRIFGVATTPVPDGIVWNHVSGLQYRSQGASVVGAQGYVDLTLAALSKGSATRLNAGETLTMDEPIDDLQEDAELQLALDEEGVDDEQDGAYSARIAQRWQSPPLAGSDADWVRWATEEAGIAAAFTYPIRGGLGTVHIAPLAGGSGAARVLSAPETDELEAVLHTKRPVAMKGMKVLHVVATTQNVELRVTPNGDPKYAFDWDDTAAPTTDPVDFWDAPTRRMQLAADRPETMKAGDRVTFSDGATGRERVIESLDGTDAVILEEDATGDVPTAATTVYSGGPLVQTIRAQVQALFGSLGTANPDASPYGTWEGNLRTEALLDAAGVAGVRKRELVTPGADVAADDPDPATSDEIGLIIAGRILVRWKH